MATVQAKGLESDFTELAARWLRLLPRSQHAEAMPANSPATSCPRFARVAPSYTQMCSITPGKKISFLIWRTMMSHVMQTTAHVMLTSRALAQRYPARGSMPPAVVEQLYAIRRTEVETLAARASIEMTDLAHLDRGARFMVADTLFASCRPDARHALLNDEHHSVRSAADIASRNP